MRKLLEYCVIFLLFMEVFSACAEAQERDRAQLREAYLAIVHKNVSETFVNDFFIEGSHGNSGASESLYSDEQEAALAHINFIRYLSGLGSVELSEELNECAGYAAELMAENRMLSHEPQKPEDMEEAVYEKGKDAAANCNLAMFNWNEEGLLEKAVVYFAQDAGARNQYVLGHRRWLLYPYMKYTGFAIAEDEEGRSYAAMYAMDDSAQDADYDMICFPSGGAFPTEYMSADMAWSVSFNPEKYDLMNSTPYIMLTEQRSGALYLFERLNTQEELEESGQYFILSGGRYGDGPAYIFKPDLSEYDELMYGYEQNQVWNVCIAGMRYADGTLCEPIEYRVEMASLTPIAPSAVEIMPRERTMKTGECAALAAQVIPQWADDLSVVWSSTDEKIASVDENGMVYAVRKGECEIIARTVNGREDRITVVVNQN